MITFKRQMIRKNTDISVYFNKILCHSNSLALKINGENIIFLKSKLMLS